MSIESDLKEWDGEFPKKENNKQEDKEYLEMVKFGDDRFNDGYKNAIEKFEKMVDEMNTISDCKIVNNPKIKLIRREILLKQLQELKEMKEK